MKQWIRLIALTISIGTSGAANAQALTPAGPTDRLLAIGAAGSMMQLDACGLTDARMYSDAKWLRNWIDHHSWRGAPLIDDISKGGMERMLQNDQIKKMICAQTRQPAVRAKLRKTYLDGVAQLKSEQVAGK